MNAEELRSAIRALLTSHPSVEVSPAGHAKHAERYLCSNGAPIGLEPARVRFQNLWVRSDSVRRNRLDDIEHTFFDHQDFAAMGSKPNHDLYGETRFKDCDLLRYRIHDLWQSVRVIEEVAGKT